MTDIEIARSTKLLSIDKIASEIGLNSDEYFMYGKYKCKIDNSVYNRLKNKKNGKLIYSLPISFLFTKGIKLIENRIIIEGCFPFL